MTPDAEADFEAMFDATWARASAAAGRILGSKAAGEDAAAEALARAYDRWARVQPLPHREAWVLRVAINIAFRARRKGATDGSAAPAVAEIRDLFEDITGDDVADRIDLEAALRNLPRRQRDVVALHYLVDLSVDDVAAALHISPGAVKTHLHRACEELRRVEVPIDVTLDAPHGGRPTAPPAPEVPLARRTTSRGMLRP